jgi:hypothetical protein
MKPLEEIYKNQYFKSRQRHLAWRAPIVCTRLRDIFPCKSVIDVGCAVGDLVDGFLAMGLDAMGLEGAKWAMQHMMVPERKIIVHDLRLKLETSKSFDLVVCFEVAEHIEPEYADIFVDNLQALARHWIVISAAPPGQGGTYHVNCQPMPYWIDKFFVRGFKFRSDLTDEFKHSLSDYRHKPGIKAYYDNALAFEKI